jgi:hypothetical protein
VDSRTVKKADELADARSGRSEQFYQQSRDKNDFTVDGLVLAKFSGKCDLFQRINKPQIGQ